ncbi:hypothetical protein BT69DRAFT_1338887 [Atractiella rhizophila]|nr:hypothetical protein BT69DRAFT_1338887 [Atractiella rhizophila]
MRFLTFFSLTAISLQASAQGPSRVFTFTNSCGRAVYILPTTGSTGTCAAGCPAGSYCNSAAGICFWNTATPSHGNWKLAAGQTSTITIPYLDNGSDFDWSGNFAFCEDGSSCSADATTCTNSGCAAPVGSKAEITLVKKGADTYDVRGIHVDVGDPGVNVPISFTPSVITKNANNPYECANMGGVTPSTGLGASSWKFSPPDDKYIWVSGGSGASCSASSQCPSGQYCGTVYTNGVLSRACGTLTGYWDASCSPALPYLTAPIKSTTAESSPILPICKVVMALHLAHATNREQITAVAVVLNGKLSSELLWCQRSRAIVTTAPLFGHQMSSQLFNGSRQDPPTAILSHMMIFPQRLLAWLPTLGGVTPSTGLGASSWKFSPPDDKYIWVSGGSGASCSASSQCPSGQYCGTVYTNGVLSRACGTLTGYWSANQGCILQSSSSIFDCPNQINNGGIVSDIAHLQGCDGATSGSCYQPGADNRCCGCAQWETILGTSLVPAITGDCYNSSPVWTSDVLPTIQWIKAGSPNGYTFPYDDISSTATCVATNSAGYNTLGYTIELCPQGTDLFGSTSGGGSSGGGGNSGGGTAGTCNGVSYTSSQGTLPPSLSSIYTDDMMTMTTKSATMGTFVPPVSIVVTEAATIRIRNVVRMEHLLAPPTFATAQERGSHRLNIPAPRITSSVLLETTSVEALATNLRSTAVVTETSRLLVRDVKSQVSRTRSVPLSALLHHVLMGLEVSQLEVGSQKCKHCQAVQRLFKLSIPSTITMKPEPYNADSSTSLSCR